MTTPRFIITRPQPEAGRWVNDLTSRGFSAHALPLIKIAPLDHQALRTARAKLAEFDALMFVSPAAVHAFFAAPPAQSNKTRFLATGPGTARALLSHQVPPEAIDAPAADSPQFDSEALWKRVGERNWQNKSVLIVRGQDANASATQDNEQGTGRDWLSRQFQTAGAVVQLISAYERRSPNWSAQEQSVALEALGDGSVWVFSSSDAVRNLAAWQPTQDWRNVPCICTHERIAQTTRALGFTRIQICTPTLDALAALCHAQ